MALNTMQGLTPTISIIVPDTIDLTQAANVYVSFKQGHTLLKLTEGFDVSAHQVDVYLTQEQTLGFREGGVTVQLNWTYDTGQRGATKLIPMSIDSNHLLEVLP